LRKRGRTVEVDIFDQKYSIVLKADMQESEVLQIAAEVDARMRALSAAANTPDSLKIAVLTALHLAFELKELRTASEEWAQALDEVLTR
jgi:cell division protein ZapA (FtsZ GTPase activity inhibitor)